MNTYRKFLLWTGIICILIILGATVLLPESSLKEEPTAASAGRKNSGIIGYGSAKSLQGSTVVVSIFGNDATTSWDKTFQDHEKEDQILKYLGIAGDYLEDVAEDYGKEADFITDFKTHPDLRYQCDLDLDLTDQSTIDSGDADQEVWEFIDSSIDSDAIREKYSADNLVYMVFLDTDESNESISCTLSWYDGVPYDYEFTYLFNVDCGVVNCPAVYAHEILHTFGAPDLYMEDDWYGIDEEFLDYVEGTLPNEIMLTCSDLDSDEYVYDRITNEVSEITAYYVGLIDESDIVTYWGLELSEHLK